LETSRNLLWKLQEISSGNTKGMDTKTYPGFWGELMGRTYLIFGFRSLQKPNEIKGSGDGRFHIAHMK
jgi:hypothetical protein